MESQIQSKLLLVQGDLKAPKNRYNSFGKYNYRDAEGILEAVKPLLLREGLLLSIADEIILIGERYYVKATATIHMGDKTHACSAFAREDENKKGQDSSQTTGSTSSYARKYALNGLFLIDDTQDSDGTNDGSGEAKKPAKRQEDKKQAQQQAAASNEAPVAKKPVAKESNLYNKLAAWLSETDGMVLDLVDSLKEKYDITDEIGKSMAEDAAKLREGKK